MAPGGTTATVGPACPALSAGVLLTPKKVCEKENSGKSRNIPIRIAILILYLLRINVERLIGGLDWFFHKLDSAK
jgi:hypothetical protein